MHTPITNLLFDRWTTANEQLPENYDFFGADFGGGGTYISGKGIYLRRGFLLNVNAAYTLPAKERKAKGE